jgi:hypothetical protein
MGWFWSRRPGTRSTSNGSETAGERDWISSIQQKYRDNYRDFQESAILDQKLKRKAVAKNLNIPWGMWDEMRDMIVSNNGVMPLVVALLFAALGVGGTMLYQQSKVKQPAVIEKANGDADTQYRIVPLPGE